ncbi:MAG: GTPase [Candidatus Tokpelaia sp. JSC161]|jgi:tRNA modification GTPase|nr:MAG: GTPase [Candidatus Tokpelaia sp. JSC161]
MDTIFALSSGLLPSAIAVVRLSGKSVKNILTQLVGFIPKPRNLCFHSLRSSNGEILDQAMIVYFPSPHSFTGEDCAEFHLHGSKAVVSRLFRELSEFSECRLAEAGEFARRAFYKGKLDLTEAEGLADLINAETESQRRLAMMGASGSLGNLYRQWRKKLIKARSLLELDFDFSEEEDISSDLISDQVWEKIRVLIKEISEHILAAEQSGILRDGLKIVITGSPNSGKSTLMNRLVGRDISIVTQEEGTTRDVIEVNLILESVPVLIMDTAGLRDAESLVEAMGIHAALQHIKKADLVLVVDDMHNLQKINLPETQADVWYIGNKSDLGYGNSQTWPIQISAKTGKGLDHLMKNLNLFCQNKITKFSDMIPAKERHVTLLKDGLDELKLALEKTNLEFCAEHLRRASDSLGRITGDIHVEDLLDSIFSEFCIGK